MTIYHARSVVAGLLASVALLFAFPALAEAAQTAVDSSKPPIVVMPLREVEPPRKVPAAEWKSPYCGLWDDGCTECSRTAPGEKATCKPVDTYVGGGNCKPRGVVCSDLVKVDGLVQIDRVCSEWGWVTIARLGTRWPDAMVMYLTGFDYDSQTRKWRDNRTVLGPLDRPRQEQFARRVMSASGRVPEVEFNLTRKDSILTMFCTESWESSKAPHVQEKDWFQLMGETKP